ncbi:hypothetical protein [Sulfurirhabdus autotrophica]|uniref:Uncharacterized protein n=1 Tax=Sulfurirhabdus autotrophica TaxID=1706046 RepID=A0A4R3YI01_9PROT|nr:hypothetical protein [Sulfurirhabdus autotrophica]TCV90634.1 hypothetical protein EDC63_101608 [Sulfurirhabdus autotrophica]
MEPDMTHNQSGSLVLPMILLTIALIIWAVFQSVQLYKERQNLKLSFDNQEQLIVNGKKMRTQLDAIAAGTKRLADQGNANAQLIVQQLAKNGISINPNQQAAALK